jgi:hypothetical protein
MRLAAVNPRVDFGGIDNFLTTEVLFSCHPFFPYHEASNKLGLHGFLEKNIPPDYHW